MNLLTQEPKAFGLDISDLSLKLAMLERKGKSLRLVSFNQVNIPPKVVKHGEIKNEKKLGEIIREAVSKTKGKKIRTKYVICSLPEEKAFLDVIQMPQIPEENLKEAVRLEAENYIPLPANSVCLDSQVIRPLYDHVKNMEVLVGAISKNIADSYIETIKLAGFRPLALEIESLAIARAIVPKENKSSPPLLIIDFGATRTSFIIFGEGSVRFTTTIPVSSQGITNLIAKVLKTPFKKAEELKIDYGMRKKEIFETVIPPLTDLVEQIKTHLDYYYSHAPKEKNLIENKTIKKILLCGGGALLKGLPEFLESELKMEVKLANPWINILKEPLKEIPGLSYKKSLEYATALGLALRGVNGA
ncbi:type IV pilus assembly protein PilM [bacterium]|nr:type IV pilus assembly protein PilM [bacterium]